MTQPNRPGVTKVWLHTSSSFGVFAHPVYLLSCGPKRAVVRLRWRMRWKRRDIPAASIRYVPSHCVSDAPWPGALVCVAACKFIPPFRAEAISTVRTWRSTRDRSRRPGVTWGEGR